MKSLSIVLSLTAILRPGLAEENRYRDFTRQGMAQAYSLQIDAATQTFDRAIQLDPQNPLGYLLQAVNYFYRLQFEVDGRSYEDQFKKYVSEAIRLARRNLASKESGLDALFYLGTANIYLAAFHSTQENWIKAYWYGKDGIDYLKQVVAIDPDYYDAYLGLGLYHYYADFLPKFVKTVGSLFGIEGDRQRGLEELERAADHGAYSKAEALFFLANIYLYGEKEYEQALTYSQRLSRLHPRGFRIFHGEVLQRNGRHREAARVFESAIADYDSTRFPFFTIWAYHSLGNVYFELNEFPQAIAAFSRASQLADRFGNSFRPLRAWSTLKLAESYELNDQRPYAKLFYARVYKSDHEDAFKIAANRLQRALSFADMQLIQGNNLMRTGDFEQAVVIYRDLLEKIRDDTRSYPSAVGLEVLYRLGKAYFEMGEFNMAVIHLKKVTNQNEVKKKGLQPWARYYLGKCYLQLGHTSLAKAEWKLAYSFHDDQLRFEIDRSREILERSSGRTTLQD